MDFSIIAIVYNEEQRLRKCLEQFIPYTDDIVVFDTESTDNTKLIAKHFTPKLWTVPYVGYCDCYKEHAMLRAKYEWCLFAYPDEVWSKELLQAIKTITVVGLDVIMFKRREFLDGVEQVGESGTHLRVFRKAGAFLCDLLDCEIVEKEKCHLIDVDRIIHDKSTEDHIIDNKHRRFANETMIHKYRATKLKPYVDYVESYKQQLSAL